MATKYPDWEELSDIEGELAEHYRAMQAKIEKLTEGWNKELTTVVLLEAKVEKLEAMPKYHHPDCNWWKWEQGYSWDVTDCNCDKVAGPALKQEGE
jgi:hypothetical protein